MKRRRWNANARNSTRRKSTCSASQGCQPRRPVRDAEYHFAKEENRTIQRQLAELEMKLKGVSVISNESVPENVVFIGHTVKLLDLYDDSEQLVQIVERGAENYSETGAGRQRQQPDGRGPGQGPRGRHRQGQGPAQNQRIQSPGHRRLIPTLLFDRQPTTPYESPLDHLSA